MYLAFKDVIKVDKNMLLSAIPYINSETNPPLSHVINVVSKYLTHFLGISFGVATLPISCNTE